MTLINNEAQKQFQLQVEEETVYIEYMIANDRIYLTHTEVPRSLEGKGHGSTIVKLALAHIDERDMKLVPMCPFVAAYIKRHPEWKRIVWEGITIA